MRFSSAKDYSMLLEIAQWIIAIVALYAFGGVVADAVVPATSRQHH
jgi:hypothetical protein